MDTNNIMLQSQMSYRLCVIGNPVQHSKSPWVHNQFAQQLGISIDYTKIEPPIDGFKQCFKNFIQSGGNGANVTAPFKQDAFAIADSVSPRALIANSVNTLKIMPDSTVWGDNTDGIGLMNDIQNNIKYNLMGKVIVILGAGGAVRGILNSILDASPQKLLIINRTKEKAINLAAQFNVNTIVSGGDMHSLDNLHADVIIDGTSFGSNICLPESFSLAVDGLCYDLKYSSEVTNFMKWGYRHNILHVYDGLGMLIEQAAESFYLWTGYYPTTKSVLALGRKNFVDIFST